MDEFQWAQNNLGIDSPEKLQAEGVNVFFAPNIDTEIKVVNLGNGRVDLFDREEERPQSGYFLSFDDLERYCLRRGLPLAETNGQVSIQPVGFDEAGDPLQHRGP